LSSIILLPLSLGVPAIEAPPRPASWRLFRTSQANLPHSAGSLLRFIPILASLTFSAAADRLTSVEFLLALASASNNLADILGGFYRFWESKKSPGSFGHPHSALFLFFFFNFKKARFAARQLRSFARHPAQGGLTRGAKPQTNERENTRPGKKKKKKKKKNKKKKK